MKKIDFNGGWRFKTEGHEWSDVTLPHDAQLLDDRRADSAGGSGHGYFVGNIYYYEKSFEAPAEWADMCVQILFEGIYKNSTVCLNGEKLAEHRYGYTPFTVDLSGKMKIGQENILSVTADNSKLPNSRWYSGGGIYRPVSLLVSQKNGIAWQGIKIRTESIQPAVISVKVDAEAEVSVEIFEGANVPGFLGKAYEPVLKSVATAQGKDVKIQIPDAKLWSADEPNLYICKVTTKTADGAIDSDEAVFGIRTISWSPKGFLVNGKQTLLKGGCIHHDNGIVGAASYKESEFRRVRILKENGFNAIRVSHNPASTALLEACDYYGMYVMDETFDMWYVKKNKYDYGCDFRECWKDDVMAMIDRDFDHPSVVMYSIGNEVSEPGKPEGVELGKEIISFIKALDDSRAVTGGMNLMIMTNYAKGKGQYDNVEAEQSKKEAEGNSKKSEEDTKDPKNGSLIFNTMATFIGSGMNKAANSDKADKIVSPILDALDIAGYNYANGRYAMEGEKHPDRIIVGSETFPYEIGKNWDMVEKYPYLIGDFMWTSWDYLGESGLGAWSYTGGMPFNRPYPWVLGGAGVIDILGNPDASIGLAQAVWKHTEKPVIGVRPVNHPRVRASKSVWRGTNALQSWSWSKCDGNKAIVEVFAKADSVEVFINGKSLGKKKIKDYQAMFKTIYEAGNIEAISFDEAGKEIGRSTLKSATGEINPVIVSEKTEAVSGEVIYFDVQIQGENAVVDSNSDLKLKVSAVEGGELLGFGSANPCTEENFKDGEYTTYYGRAQAIVRVKEGADKVSLTLADANGKTYTSNQVTIFKWN